MLIEDAAKPFEKLAKDLVDEILTDYTVSTSQPSLPVFQHSNGAQNSSVQDTM